VGREHSHRHPDLTGPAPSFRPSRSEFVLLLVAALLYWFQPVWPALRFAPAFLEGGVRDWVGERGARMADWKGARRKLEASRRENEQLRAELLVKDAEVRMLSLQVLENDALRSLFSLSKRPDYRYLYGEVRSRKVRSTDARLFVRVAGMDPAIRETLPGAPVVAAVPPQWIAVGQVVQAKESLVEVMLLSDPRSRIGVTAVDTPSLGSALMIGAGADRMVLDFVAHPTFVKKLYPDLILVTGPESRFPQGLAAARLAADQGHAESGWTPDALRPRPVVPYEELPFVVILAPLREDQRW